VLLAIVVVIAQILGVLSSINALLTTRTAQGAIAWIVSLNTFPYLAVPAYWIFGRSKFNGYVLSRKEVDARLTSHVGELRDAIRHRRSSISDRSGWVTAIEKIAKIPFTGGNHTRLLIDGAMAFPQMFDAIGNAERYVLVQFYILRSDRIGQEFKRLLIETAARGVAVYALFDEIGSYSLSRRYLRELRDAGVAIHPFLSTRGRRNRFQLNFRNHRKAIVVDGRIGFVGGLNVGDEYLGRKRRYGPWRDTHLAISGPAVVGLQLPFAEDWHWATGTFLELDWESCLRGDEETGGHDALLLPSGPADDVSTASLMMQQLINAAHRRLWIASPYFVPDESVQDALKLPVLRGVDVQILIPDRPDHLLVYLSAFAFVGPMIEAGVGIRRYVPGFLHEKVFLVDNTTAGVGTVNLDNRSFRLNFEITAIVYGRDFAADVAAMFERDFARSREMRLDEVRHMPLWRRVLSRLAYLLAPIQ